jgi:hypothetical protein
MQVASLELCKTLYELSDWELPKYFYKITDNGGHTWSGIADRGWCENYVPEDNDEKIEYYPAYSLDYLFRKIQEKLPKGEYVGLSADNNSEGSWFASISNDHSIGDTAYSDTPENATVKLCIELFKQNILTKEGK